MHPLFRSVRHLVIGCLSWIPVCVLMVILIQEVAGIQRVESSLLTVPPLFLMFFLSLSTWYLCKVLPLSSKTLFRILLMHLVSALLMISFWIVVSRFYAKALDVIFKANSWDDNFSKVQILFIVAGVGIYFLASLFHYLLISLERTRRVEQQILKERLLASQTELRTLKASIHPHFLFNTLTALSVLTIKNPLRAKEVCLQMSDFLRYSIRHSQKTIVLVKDELGHIQNYLDIEKIRLGARLNVVLDIQEKVKEITVLPLTLLPLVENAVKHGVQQCLEGGTISVAIGIEPGFLCIDVSNPLPPDDTVKPEGEGLGVRALKQRLVSLYGREYRLFTKKKESTFHVYLQLPLDRGDL
jgi:two-component system LytT family sensor kinase